MLSNYEKLDFSLAKRYVDAVLTMNEIYQRTRKKSDDSLANELFTPEPIVAIDYSQVGDWQETRSLLLNIYNQYDAIKNETRKCYMKEQILSVFYLGEWVFEKKETPYMQMVANLLRVDPTPVTASEINADKNLMSYMLEKNGFLGKLEDQFNAWRETHKVPADKLQLTLDELIKESRQRTLNLGLGKDDDASVTSVLVYNVGYQGYCDFDNRIIYINGDLDYTIQSLRILICHEAYPGHVTHMQIRKEMVEAERIPLDAALVVVNTASSPIFEGLADNGIKFIGLNNGSDDTIGILYEQIKEKAVLTASYLLHEEKRSKADVTEYLKNTAFVDDAWASARMKLMSYPLRKPFFPSYWRGNQAVREVWRRVGENQKEQFLHYLYENMHSVNSLQKFC